MGEFILQRLQRGTFRFDMKPTVLAFAGVAGKKEGEGPLGESFDKVHEDPMLGQVSWEKAESTLQQEAINIALDARLSLLRISARRNGSSARLSDTAASAVRRHNGQ